MGHAVALAIVSICAICTTDGPWKAAPKAVLVPHSTACRSAMQALFQPFRALGYISDDVPFAVQRRGKETFVTVSVGKAWQVGPLACAAQSASVSAYCANRLQLCLVSAGVLLLQTGRQACGASGLWLGCKCRLQHAAFTRQSMLLFAAVRAQRQGTGMSR